VGTHARFHRAGSVVRGADLGMKIDIQPLPRTTTDANDQFRWLILELG
jgi:hypothetical protein